MAPYQTTCNYYSTTSATSDVTWQTTTWYDSATASSSCQVTDNRYVIIYYAPTVTYYPQSTDNTYVWDYKVVETKIPEAERRKQFEEAERERKRRLEEYERMEKERQKAEEKAVDCLLDVVGQEQADIYKRTGNLLVKGEKFDWLFDKEGKVYRCEKDKVVQLCLHSDEKHRQPVTDNVITLALHAKFAEKEMEKGHLIREIKKQDFTLPEAANF